MAKKSNFKGAMKAAQESGVLRRTESTAAPSSSSVATGGEPDMSQPLQSSSMTATGPSGSSDRQGMTTDKKDVPKWFKLGHR